MSFDYSLKINSKLCGDAQLFGAFECGDILTFSLRVERKAAASEVLLEFKNDTDENVSLLKFNYEKLDFDYDIYSFSLLLDTKGLYFYSLSVNSFGTKRYLIKDSQLTVYKKGFDTPSWIKGGIMYQIFVDRFKKSGKVDAKRDDIVSLDWYNDEPTYPKEKNAFTLNNSFYGGDLYGVAEKLDYIKSLGANTIYLCPVFKAYSNHKYDTGDYDVIDEMFGGEDAFDFLLSEAGKRNMHIILDGVFNHTGDNSRYFNKEGRYDSLGAYQSKESPFYDWYNFKSWPDDYESWWGIEILPRTNPKSEGWMNYINGKDGIIQKYIKRGISGWRLDVADELSDEFLDKLNLSAKSAKEDALIIGEVWEDASNKISYSNRRKYLQGDELDSVMNYVMREAVVKLVTEKYMDGFVSSFNTIYHNYPKCVSDSLMNILGTHDTARILNVLGGHIDENATNDDLCRYRLDEGEYRKAKDGLKIAYAVCASLPGVPCIYYGDEAGMQGWGDPFCRRPYPWGMEDTELLDYYKTIGNIRTKEKLYIDSLADVYTDNLGLLHIKRYNQTSFIDTLVNIGENEVVLEKSIKNLINGEEMGTVLPFSCVICKGKC